MYFKVLQNVLQDLKTLYFKVFYTKEQKDIVVLDINPQQSVEVLVNIRGKTDLSTFPLFNKTGNITDTLKQMIDKYDTLL
ncbi:Plasmid partitioning protein ParA [Helicobacter heilmannii]|nr:Plasmid partitioning protein ParA [Helicobacter heilmannii]